MAEEKDTTGEEWRKIPGWDDFSASSLGQIRRDVAYPAVRKNGSVGIMAAGRRCGYPVLWLVTPRRSSRREYVHRLVVASFLGPIPEGMHVNHKNGDRTDNRIENLEVVTVAQNFRHGHWLRAAKKLRSKTGRSPGVTQLPSGHWGFRMRTPTGRPHRTYPTKEAAEMASLWFRTEAILPPGSVRPVPIQTDKCLICKQITMSVEDVCRFMPPEDDPRLIL